MTIKLPTAPVEKKHEMWDVLDPTHHDPLVRDIDKFAKMAGIQKHWIWAKTEEFLTTEELNWVTKFRTHGPNNLAGMVMVGLDPEPPVEIRMYAIAGKLTRNFVWGQVLTIQQLIPMIEKNDLPQCTCLLIPNLYPGKGAVPSWKAALILDLLMGRASDGKQTVIAVDHLQDLEGDFGSTFFKFIDSRFAQLAVGG